MIKVEVSTLLIHDRPEESREAEWARLIPGTVAALRKGARKPPQSVMLAARDEVMANLRDESWFAMLLPNPLRTRMAAEWLRSMGADWALVALDWLLIGALLVALHGLFPGVRSFRYAAGTPMSLLGIAFLHAALITLVGYTESVHATGRDLRARTRALGKSVLLATVILGVAYGLQGSPWTICSLFCAAGFMHFGALWMWRWRAEQSGVFPRNQVRNVLIVGAGPVGRNVASYVEEHPRYGRRVCGFLDDDRPLANGVVGRVADLARIAREQFVDEVILAAPRSGDLTRHLLREARMLRLDLEVVPELYGCKPARCEVERVGEIPVISLHAERLPSARLTLKRVTDVVGATVMLTLLAPIFAAIAILIKLDSSGGVFYCAQRAGRKGRLFRCYKFRTMVSNADELKSVLRRKNERVGPMFKMARDPRVTRVGHYFRRYSLDELPQLWNVLKGEMSLVGPRPHPLDDVAAYEIEHLARLDVTPGMTGLWQIRARRDPSFERGMELDREYISTWSLGLDLRILMRTLFAVMQGSGD